MPKTQEVPGELRAFNEVFEAAARYERHATVYADFVRYAVECFNVARTPGALKAEMVKRYAERYELFPQMFAALVQAQQEGLKRAEWYDALGTYYELINSAGHAQHMGQFFTPPELCNLSARINGPANPEAEVSRGLRVNDPACGSGRQLMAFNAVCPGNYLYGEDLDPLCAQMAVVNFCLHGMSGQVSRMDTLKIEWYWGWECSPLACRPIEREQSYTWRMWHTAQGEPRPITPAPAEPTPKPPATPQAGTQLRLFT